METPVNASIRTAHRWLSIVFTVAVLINIAAQVAGVDAVWIGLLALVPLILMMISGLWMFAQPYLRRSAR